MDAKESRDAQRRYKAFISYRHLPLEMSVAKKMHRRIEHYVIPRELRKNGEKKLGYVFRDQDELPIASSLTDNIQAALDRSEFLIVICSPETAKSEWVQREITYFIETHDREHVLAVLADGTPEAAFPRPLTEILSEDGDVLKQIEPLAANIVAPTEAKRNRLFASESLRILAALIGCPYDALYKREQRYKLRRIGAAAALAAAVAAVFIGTLIDRNREIRANYEQSLRNQSQYLASEALKSLEEGDRLGAISLAIEALPSETRERPYVSKAEFALANAVGAYTAPGNAVGLEATGVLTHSGPIYKFVLNDSGALLCSRTREGVLSGWDTGAMRELWSLAKIEGKEVAGIAGFLNERELVAWSDKGVCCVDAGSGDVKWSRSAEALTGSAYMDVDRVRIAAESGDVIACGYKSIVRLDGGTGETLQTLAWPTLEKDGTAASFYSFRFQVSPDGDRLAAEYSYSLSGLGMGVVDLRDGSLLLAQDYSEDYYFADEVLFPDSDTFLYVSSDLSGGSASTFMDMKIMVSSTNVLHCVDLRTGENRWETEHVSSTTGANDTLRLDSTLLGRPVVIYAYANHMDVVDLQTGDFLAQTEFSSRIMSVNVFNGRIHCITDDGERGQVILQDPSEWYSKKTFMDDILVGDLRPGSGWFAARLSPELVHYGPIQADPAWTSIEMVLNEGADSDFYDRQHLVSDGCIALANRSRLLINDGDPAHPLRELVLPNYKDDSDILMELTLCRRDEDELRLSWSNTKGCGVAYVGTEAQDYRMLPWEDPELALQVIYDAEDSGGDWYALAARAGERDGESAVTLYALRLDRELAVRQTLEIGTLGGEGGWSSCYDHAGRLYVYLESEGKSWCADFRKGEIRENSEAMTNCFAALHERGEDPDVRSAFAADGSLLALKSADADWTILDTAGAVKCTIHGETTMTCAASFTPDGQYLLTLEDDAFLRRYRVSDGELLSRSEVYSGAINGRTSISWQYTDSGLLAVNIDEYLNLVSMADWGVISYVSACLGYLPEQDFFVCYDYPGSEKEYGGFYRHSSEELIEYGRSILNGWEMSDARRMDYGLD